MARIEKQAWRRVTEGTKQIERTYRNRLPSIGGTAIVLPSYAGITYSPITARAGKTPGTGQVQRYVFNGTMFVIDVDPPVDVFNWTGSAIAANLWVEYHALDGYLFVNGTDCSGVAP